MSKRKYFSDLWGELKKPDAKLRTAYLLYGPEEFLARKALERIEELCGDVKPFDRVEALGSESGLAEVADELNTPPMVALRRLVVIRQAEKLLAKAYRGGKASREAVFLKETLSQSDCTGCLVLLASPDVTLASIPGGTFRDALPTYGSYPLRDAQLVQWVRRGAEERRLTMGREVIVRLIATVGNSLMDLENEGFYLLPLRRRVCAAEYQGGDGDVPVVATDLCRYGLGHGPQHAVEADGIDHPVSSPLGETAAWLTPTPHLNKPVVSCLRSLVFNRQISKLPCPLFSVFCFPSTFNLPLYLYGFFEPSKHGKSISSKRCGAFNEAAKSPISFISDSFSFKIQVLNPKLIPLLYRRFTALKTLSREPATPVTPSKAALLIPGIVISTLLGLSLCNSLALSLLINEPLV